MGLPLKHASPMTALKKAPTGSQFVPSFFEGLWAVFQSQNPEYHLVCGKARS